MKNLLLPLNSFVLALMVSGCSTVPKGSALSAEREAVKMVFADKRVLQVSDLDEDSKSYFLSLPGHDDPGLVCGHFSNQKDLSCAALLVNERGSNKGAQTLVFFRDIKSTPTGFEIVEDYSTEKRQTTNIFLIYIKKSALDNRGEGLTKVQMASDGVQRISNGQSAMVFFEDQGLLKKVWTAD